MALCYLNVLQKFCLKVKVAPISTQNQPLHSPRLLTSYRRGFTPWPNRRADKSPSETLSLQSSHEPSFGFTLDALRPTTLLQALGFKLLLAGSIPRHANEPAIRGSNHKV
ncbi:jg12171 [Pararge aegeria aegeria]|uniref:Jg12171 protein n=1 Tax=Pararge aegeria aegeria TaxID=348720 RepID=A0A8S4RNK6_9NEOP|nr:jg12171 [Pararge aegeria aegeria]